MTDGQPSRERRRAEKAVISKGQAKGSRREKKMLTDKGLALTLEKKPDLFSYDDKQKFLKVNLFC